MTTFTAYVDTYANYRQLLTNYFNFPEVMLDPIDRQVILEAWIDQDYNIYDRQIAYKIYNQRGPTGHTVTKIRVHPPSRDLIYLMFKTKYGIDMENHVRQLLTGPLEVNLTPELPRPSSHAFIVEVTEHCSQVREYIKKMVDQLPSQCQLATVFNNKVVRERKKLHHLSGYTYSHNNVNTAAQLTSLYPGDWTFHVFIDTPFRACHNNNVYTAENIKVVCYGLTQRGNSDALEKQYPRHIRYFIQDPLTWTPDVTPWTQPRRSLTHEDYSVMNWIYPIVDELCTCSSISLECLRSVLKTKNTEMTRSLLEDVDTVLKTAKEPRMYYEWGHAFLKSYVSGLLNQTCTLPDTGLRFFSGVKARQSI